MADKSARRLLRAEKGARQIQVDDPSPVRERHFQKRGVGLCARVGDHYVDTAKMAVGGIEQFLDIPRLGDVAADRDGAPFPAQDLFRHGLARGHVVVMVDDNRRPRLSERQSDRLSDARARAGHDSPLAG